MANETVLSSERIYDGKIISLRIDHVRLPDGDLHKREIVEHRGAVAMVALDEEEHIYLVRQYRSATQRVLLEIPAGTLEAGEEPLVTAERELQEEIGMFPASLEPLGTFYLAPGYSDERIHLFLARQLRPASLPADSDEDISVERMPLAEGLRLIDEGAVEDAKTIAGLLRVARYLKAKSAE